MPERARNIGICASCGDEVQLTLEHVPPKSLFAKPRPEPLGIYTCTECNKGSSNEDELLKVLVALGVTKLNPRGEDLSESLQRTIAHNAKIRRKIIYDATPSEIRTDSGIFVQAGMKIPFDIKPIIPLFVKMARCLFYYEHSFIVPRELKPTVQVVQNHDIPEGWLNHPSDTIKSGFVGDLDRFAYTVALAQEYPDRFGAQIQWCLYGRLGAMVLFIDDDEGRHGSRSRTSRATQIRPRWWVTR